ncbi:MAG: cell division protein ZapA [Rikenellaceae bacterium]
MTVENEYKINVRVGDKSFPMTVKPKEEAYIRTAAEKVTKLYKQYAKQLPNTFDRMSIIALQMAIRNEENEHDSTLTKAMEELKGMCEKIDEMILNDSDNNTKTK